MNFIDLINVSVQVILFPLNLVLRASLTNFGMESKKSSRMMFILLILTLSLQWWLLIRSKFFSNFSNRKNRSYWQIWLVLIICLAIIIIMRRIIYCHLVSLYEKNRDHYPLAGSQWLFKYICKLFIRSLGPL